MVENVPDSHTSELMLAEALRSVPGFRPEDPPSQTVRLPGGSFNRSYLVATAAGRFVVRLSEEADAWLASDRSVERELHGIAAAAGLAPQVVHADSRDRWLITCFAAGQPWTEREMSDPHHLSRLAGTLRQLHALPPPASDCGRVNLLAVLDDYGQRIRMGQRDGRDTSAMARFLQHAEEAWRVCGALERPAAIVHHDLNAANIIEGPVGPLLIDWECAAVSDPLLDVACILSYYPGSWPHAAVLLRDCGFEGLAPRQLAAAVWLFDLHTWLWFRERRLRLLPTHGELAVEQKLLERLPGGLERWQTATS